MRGPLVRRTRRPLFGKRKLWDEHTFTPAEKRAFKRFKTGAGRAMGAIGAATTAYDAYSLARRVGRNISNKRKWSSYKEAPAPRRPGFGGLTPTQQSILRKRKYRTPTGQMSEDLQRKVARHGKYRAHKLSRNRLKFATPF